MSEEVVKAVEVKEACESQEVEEMTQTEQLILAANTPCFGDLEDKAAVLEALIFANGEPIDIGRLQGVLNCSEELLEAEILNLLQKYRENEYGIELVKVAGKYQFRTKGKYASFVRLLKEQRPRKLSAAALETLSVVAYRQPVTRHEIEKIRGVDPTPTLKTLLERELVTLVGYKDTVGQPGLYGTTEKFLHLFGLSSLSDLPSLRELKTLEGDPGEEVYESDDSVEVEDLSEMEGPAPSGPS